MSMHISGFEKFTLLDYPGKMSAVVFTPGCVFRCPFCHNPELIEPHTAESKKLFLQNREEEFFAFLEKRKGKLDGVCITGGEPTLQKDLQAFIDRVKDMGFLVKLDTNGLFPHIVEKILASGKVDYWAIDIKHTKEKYALAVGKDINIDSVKKSVELVMMRAKSPSENSCREKSSNFRAKAVKAEEGYCRNATRFERVVAGNLGIASTNLDLSPRLANSRAGSYDYEFRTTVVPGIHTEEDFKEIGRWIKGANAYYIQEFREGKMLDSSLAERARTSHIDLDKVKKIMEKYVDRVEIRR